MLAPKNLPRTRRAMILPMMSTQPVAPIPAEPCNMINAGKNVASSSVGLVSPTASTSIPKSANASAPIALVVASQFFLIRLLAKIEGPAICGSAKLNCTIAGTIPTITADSVRWLTKTGKIVTAETRLMPVKKIRLLPKSSA